MMKKKPNHAERNRSQASKGMVTRSTILNAAHDVFKATGYYGSSVSEITRRCGVSMGTFYQYFKNKEQVFIELADLLATRFMEQVESLKLTESSFEERLKRVIHLLYRHTKENFAFHRILGESELVDRVTIGYYESIARYYRKFFRQEIQAGNMRTLDPNMTAYGLIGSCYFNALDWDEADKDISQQKIVDLLADILLNGISGTSEWANSAWKHFNMPDPEPLHQIGDRHLTKGEQTRKQIFHAAERIFGLNGINHASIAEITREAGVAQGTFYVHFESKNDLVQGFVKYMNHEMRREIKRLSGGTNDRRDAERVGIFAFYQFVREHRKAYRVVPECEMISREVMLWYYQKLAHGYIQGLKQGIQKGEIRNLPPVFLTRFLMGFTHFIGLKWIIWNTDHLAEVPEQIARDSVELILFGIKGSKNKIV